MADIIPAAQSPRIEKGTLKWFYLDTFKIRWTINLKRDDEPITYEPTDEIIFSFYIPGTDRCVHSFCASNIQDNTVELDFTSEITKKFIPGKYTYSIKFIRISGETQIEEVKTIGAMNAVEVEKCH